MLGAHLLVLLAKEGDGDKGDAGDQEEDLEEEQEVEQVDRGLCQLERSALSPRHLKSGNVLHLKYIHQFVFYSAVTKKTI